MTDADRQLIQDAYVAQILILAKQFEIKDHLTGFRTTDSPVSRAVKLISKERSGILAGRP
jgi:hypothetical protein